MLVNDLDEVGGNLDVGKIVFLPLWNVARLADEAQMFLKVVALFLTSLSIGLGWEGLKGEGGVSLDYSCLVWRDEQLQCNDQPSTSHHSLCHSTSTAEILPTRMSVLLETSHTPS